MFDMGTAVGYLMLDTSGFTKEFDSAKTSFNTFFDETSTANDKLKSLGDAMSSTGASLTKYVSLPLIGVGTASLAMAADMQGALNKIQQNTRGTIISAKEFEDVLRSVYRSGYGEGYEDIADAISLINQQMGDMPTEELEEVTESAFALRDAFGFELNESVRAADTLMQQFGISSKEAFDLIAFGAQNGLNYSGELIDTITEYSVHFAQAGLNAQQMFNVFISGADSGAWNLDKIGDAVKELGIRVREGSDESIQALQDLGLSSLDIQKQFTEGGDAASAAFQSIINALGEVEDPIEQNRIGVALMGTMWEDLGAKAVTNLTEVGNEAKNANGAIDSLKEQRLDDFNTQVETLKRSFGDLSVDIGLLLLPYVQALVENLQGAVDWFNSLDTSTQSIIIGIGAFVAVLGPALLIVGRLVNLLNMISIGLMTMGISAQMSLPALLLIIGALAALVALIVALNSARSGKEVDTNDPDFNPQTAVPKGSYAAGLDYVPSDRTVKVHEGEGILTKEENRAYRSGSNRDKDAKPMVFNFAVELDGAVVARKQYRYNKLEENYRGDNLVR